MVLADPDLIPGVIQILSVHGAAIANDLLTNNEKAQVALVKAGITKETALAVIGSVAQLLPVLSQKQEIFAELIEIAMTFNTLSGKKFEELTEEERQQEATKRQEIASKAFDIAIRLLQDEELMPKLAENLASLVKASSLFDNAVELLEKNKAVAEGLQKLGLTVQDIVLL